MILRVGAKVPVGRAGRLENPRSDLALPHEHFSLVASTAAKLLYVDSVPLSTLHESCALVNTALL